MNRKLNFIRYLCIIIIITTVFPVRLLLSAATPAPPSTGKHAIIPTPPNSPGTSFGRADLVDAADEKPTLLAAAGLSGSLQVFICGLLVDVGWGRTSLAGGDQPRAVFYLAEGHEHLLSTLVTDGERNFDIETKMEEISNNLGLMAILSYLLLRFEEIMSSRPITALGGGAEALRLF